MKQYYTSKEQSKKLVELGLNTETADMFYNGGDPDFKVRNGIHKSEDCLSCWSLGALLDVLAKKALEFDDDGSAVLSSYMGTWCVNMFDCPIECSENYNNQIDAVYEMVIKVLKYDR
ncbi:MAG: hypothetical protein J6I84_04285 [Bacilli bacterium]|nr:hypothetical protein [Bacilli bacterium]